MTDPVAIALIGIVAAAIAGIPATFAAMQSVKNGAKSDAIHTIVNSKSDEMRKEIQALKAEIAALKRDVSEAHRTIASLARRAHGVDEALVAHPEPPQETP